MTETKSTWGGKRTPGPGKKLGAPTGSRTAPEDTPKMVSLRLDPHLWGDVKEHCKATGRVQRWVVETALAAYLKNA